MAGMFCVFIVVVVMQIYACVKIHRTVHKKIKVNFSVW